ncbi:MAG: MATE family efflux transporter [Lentisphaeria bacterium]|nr:MATE family efflux transporter [Lentisphaeria bacterium]
MRSTEKYQIDMSHGPLFGKIVLFSLPLMSSYVMQVLFSTIDLIVIGRFASSKAMAAVGATSGLTVLVLNIFFGLSVGVNVLAARYIGARDRKNLSATVHTAAAVGLYGGLVMAVIGILISRPVLKMMQTPDEILNQSSLYMWIYCTSIPFIILYNFGSSILRAQGDTRRPLYYMIVGGLVKVLLNLFLVIVLRMDVGGVALATLVSNGISAGLTLLALASARDASRLIRKKIRITPDIFKDMLKIGLPAGIQGSFFSLSNIVIQSSINFFGTEAIAGNTAAQNLEGLVYVASSSFYYTAISFVGQNHGAQKYKRIVRSVLICMFCTVVLSLISGWLFYLFGKPLLKIYNADPEVIKWGMIRAKILFTTYFLCATMDTISGSLRGLGHSVKPTIVTLMGVCVFRIFWVLWIFPLDKTMENLMISYPVSWSIVSLVNGFILFWVIRKMFRQVADEHPHHGFATLKPKG